MPAQATLRHVRLSATKARYLVDQIRGRPIEEAVQTLRFSPRRASQSILKLLNSAVANAEQAGDLDLDTLVVKQAFVDDGPVLKRIRPRAQGRAYGIHHRTCHITLVLDEKK